MDLSPTKILGCPPPSPFPTHMDRRMFEECLHGEINAACFDFFPQCYTNSVCSCNQLNGRRTGTPALKSETPTFIRYVLKRPDASMDASASLSALTAEAGTPRGTSTLSIGTLRRVNDASKRYAKLTVCKVDYTGVTQLKLQK